MAVPPRSKMRLLPLGALLRQPGCFRQFAVRRPQCGFPPLEERVRERRPLRSTCQRDGLEAAGRDRGTVIVSRGLLSPALSSRGGEGEAARIVREMAMRIGTSDKSGFPVVVPGCAHVCWGGVQFNCRTSSPDLINTPLQRGVVRVRWLETVSTVSWLAWSERAIE